jgi:Zn ribbon nucleic-acid-binding protein
MTTDEQAWKDKWDGKVSVTCPKCKAVFRLRQETTERGVLIINCSACGVSFDYRQPN